MTAGHAEELVDGYISRLELELLDRPPERRREIVDDIRSHIADERGRLEDETDADLLNLFDRLGDPAEIAAVARNGRSRPAETPPTSRVGVVEVLALVLTPTIWPAGVVLLWASSAWTTKQKLLGTLVPPGGYPAVLVLISILQFISLQSTTTCGGGISSDGTAYSSCPSPQWWEFAIIVGAVAVVIALLLAPVVVGIYLATRLRSRATS